MYRRRAYVLSLALLLALVAYGLLAGAGQTSQAGPAPLAVKGQEGTVPLKPEVSMSVKNDTSLPLRDLIARQGPIIPYTGPERELPEGFPSDKHIVDTGYTGDAALQRGFGLVSPLIPSPVLTFTAIPNNWGFIPPDPNGDVGPNHYVQMVNVGFQIYNKSGVALAPVAKNNTLWAGFGGPCQTENAGDPVVLHDQMADRWLLTQFSDSTGPFFNCVALSTTSDPLGTYHRYAFSAPTFPDYPHYGIWPDAYYFNTRESGGGVLGNYAIERAQMLIGAPAQVVRFAIPELAYRTGLLPSDLDGAVLPPAGSPNYFVGTQDDGFGSPTGDDVSVYKFHVDWVTPGSSTFTGPTLLDAAPFDSNFPCSPGSRDCIPQPGTAQKIDILSYRQRPTFRLAYRNYGTHESLVTSQSVEAQPGVAGMRWYELRDPNGAVNIFQQGTYSPDTALHRWMGSIAMDGSGNMALGYSVSSSTVFPGMRYTGRLSTDPLNTMPQGEGTFIDGTGSQTSTGARWGDYTSLNVDPSDDCTFWYTNEIVPVTSATGWRGAVGTFKFPGCVPAGGSPTPTVTGTPPTATQTRTATQTATRTNTVPPTATPACSPNYVVTASTGATIVPGTALLAGTNCDDCSVALALPFAYTFYGQTFNSVNVISNGNLQFSSTNTDFTNACEPYAAHNNVIHAYWDDLLLTTAGDGVYTSVSGSTPNRIMNIEWRGCYYSGGSCGGRVSVEARLYEGQSRVDVIYATVGNGNVSATGGVQKDTGSLFLQAYCNGAGLPVTAGTMHSYSLPPCITGTPTIPATVPATATRTATQPTGGSPTSSPTCVASPAGWTAGQALPLPNVRSYGAYFPTNGRFYAMGGRSSDTAGFAQLNPLEYNPTTNTWITKTAVFSDQQTSNVKGGVLTMSGTPVIVVVGGSAGGGTGGTNETRVYNPVADTLVTLTSDPWPPGLTTVPGGSAVVANKLYIVGGYVIGVSMSDEIWEFDPAAAAGSRWSLQPVSLPAARGYIPTVAIGTMVYMAGGSDFDGTTILDTDFSFKYDTVADTVTPIATIPRPTGETVAVNMAGKMWVLGGGRDAPNPSNQVDIYDPVANSWSTGTPFVTARRNFPADTDGAGKIYLAGGYAPTAPDMSMEIYSSGTGCPGVTPSATSTTGVVATSTRTSTRTSTSTSTPMPTSTSCPFQFTDVPPDHTFYDSIRCLACRGIINGYNTGCETGNPCFKPGNFVTRGQIAKMVSNSAGFNEPAGAQQFQDVPPGHTFYDYIWRMADRGYVSGYPCGGPGEPCVAPNNLPYFRPGANITRGQLSKMVSNAAGFTEPAGAQQFQDVPPGHTFYDYIWRLTNRGIMNGYPCGGLGEPCVAPGNLPYFRPGANATRGQASKIVANTFFPNCQTPSNRVESKLIGR
jgi:hypothetical protein